ncbi:hypothetical protein OF829_09315 [Sphingomonas sp. LB-2]|uniref:hypothetical protein n=1 Tax=Sphingomonas caeni TaxID=2984949 RepID=UPI0022301AE0|nr:hypothetical protein [Sphingomonas caeni]MCW3847441.1 hypothetical protein [Sphingomonas caeni]
MKNSMILIAALALAGCTSAEQNKAANLVENDAELTANEAAGAEAVAGVVAMKDSTRNIAFIRAIIAAGTRCDGVTRSERMPDVNGQPTWRATCKGGMSHIITVSSDGTPQPVFTVTSRSD